MKTSVKHLSDTKVKLTISLDKSELDPAKQVALHKISRTIKIAGFRKGRAPLSVIEKNVDPSTLQEEIINNALSKAVADAFLQENLQALDRPQVEVLKFVPNQELEFTAESEIIPEVKLGDYRKLKATMAKTSVSDKDVDEIVQRMRENFAVKEPVDRAAELGDEVVIDFVGKKDGVVFEGGEAKDFDLKLGSGQFIPGFEEGVVGHKAGDKFDLNLEFPKEYHASDIAGKAVVFEVELKTVNKIILPEVNDEFAVKCGPFTSADELKDDIRREIEAQKDREATEKHKDNLVSELAEKSQASLPELLVNDRVKSLEFDLEQNLKRQGLTIDSYLKTQGFADKDDWIKREATPVAEKQVKAGLVLAELSKEFKIDISRDELVEQINTLKTQYGNDKRIIEQFDNPDVHRDVANRLLTDKTIAKLMEVNKRDDKTK
ncbi:trigger factor [Candidatus Saccharibacteria bacterium]|nr:trigger factor [Candidatus Saccharibacteria bacterium]